MAKKENRIDYSSFAERYMELKALRIRFVAEKAALQKLVDRITARRLKQKLKFNNSDCGIEVGINQDGHAICAADHDPMAREKTPEIQEGVKNLESEHSETVFPVAI